MRRGAKPSKARVEAKPPAARKSRKNEDSRVHDLETRLAEARAQQTATAEILRVISQSPTDLQPVLETVTRMAARLCDAVDALIFRLDGAQLRIAAHYGPIPLEQPVLRDGMPLSSTTVSGRTILEARRIHVDDLASGTADFPDGGGYARRLGYHTTLSVPLLRQDIAIGAITIRRLEVRPFTDSQMDLLETFADQAAIAIENVRLFKELEARNRDLTEALDRQTATSEILRVIASSPTDLQPVFSAIAESAKRLLGGFAALITRLIGDDLHLGALTSTSRAGDEAARARFPRAVTTFGIHTAAARTRAPFVVADIEADQWRSHPGLQEMARARGWRSFLAVPMLQGDQVLGTIGVSRREAGAFKPEEIALLETFADQAVIAIENVRLFSELQSSNHELTTALDQQTATSEVLRTIAQAQTDVQPVFDTIVQSAARLCHADIAAVFLTDGRMVYEPANFGSSPEALAATRARFPRPVDMDSTAGIAILTRSVFHVPDTEEPSVIEHLRQSGRLAGFRSAVTVPMLREGEAVGAVLVARREPGRFSDAEVGLLKTFADQAVIAVENVRLFKELERANRELAAASQHKSEFLANMSHELRTPLNAIIGFSEVLTERMFGELNEKQEEYLKDIYASGTHLLSLINDILDLSKIEAGRMELELTDFDLPQAIENAFILVRERAGRRGIALEHSVDERLAEIRGDERKVKQVLLNLLSNALKFTPDGGRVEVRAGMVDGMAEIAVTDTGVGIAPEDQEKVFEEFRQVGTADKKVEGTGLGLALSRKFVELHGGRIWVKSQVGAGSTFTFSIPLRRDE